MGKVNIYKCNSLDNLLENETYYHLKIMLYRLCYFLYQKHILFFQPHLTILDKFTLALFEDTGWYKVNYNFAEPYNWGKG